MTEEAPEKTEAALDNSQEAEEIRDADRDSMHILPLSILPIETPPLRRARLIKNAKLQSVVEVFDDIETGSGQVDIEGLPNEFEWPESPPSSRSSIAAPTGPVA